MGLRTSGKLRWHLSLCRQPGCPTLTLTMGQTICGDGHCVEGLRGTGVGEAANLEGSCQGREILATPEHSQCCAEGADQSHQWSFPGQQIRSEFSMFALKFPGSRRSHVSSWLGFKLSLCSFMTVGLSFFSCRRRSLN